MSSSAQIPILCLANGWGIPALLRLPRKRWAYYLGGVAAAVSAGYILVAGAFPAGIIIGLFSMLEVGLAAYLVIRFIGNPPDISDFHQTFQYVLLAPLVAAGIATFLGSLMLSLADGTAFTRYFYMWWSGDAVGMLTISPLALALSREFFWMKSLSPTRRIESVLLVVCFLGFSSLVYLHAPTSLFDWLDEYMIFPFLLWAAIQFGSNGATLIIALLSLVLIPSTVINVGLFNITYPDYYLRLTSVQLFLSISSVTTLLIAAMTDERNRKERQLRIQSDALEAAANSILIGDGQGKVLSVNPAFSRQTGYKAEEVVGKNVRDLGFRTSSAETWREIQSSVQAGIPWKGVALNNRKDGSSYHEDMTVTPIRDAWGKTQYVIAVMQDISERIENELSLKESEELFRAVFEGSGLGISITNPNGDFLQVNQALQDMLGYTAEELKGIPYQAITHPEDIRMNEELWKQMYSGKTNNFHMEKRYVRKDGRPIWVRLNATVVRDSRRGAFSVGMAEDITSQRQAESNLKWQLEQNLRLLAETHRRSRELEAVSEISSALRKAYSRQDMLPILLEQSLQAMQADTAALILLEEKDLVFSAEVGAAEAMHGIHYQFGRDPIWEVLHGTEPLFLTHQNRQQLADWHFARLTMGDMQAGIFAPLHSSSINVGILFLGYQRQPELIQEYASLVVAIAEIAGNALYRTEAMETLGRLVAERSEDLRTIYEVSAVANQEENLDSILERSLGHVLSAMNCRSGSIHLVNEVEETLDLAVERGTQPGLLPLIQRLPLGVGLQGWVAEQGRSLMIPDISVDGRAIRRDPIEDYSTFLGVPLRVGGKTLGVISIRREGDHPFNIDEVALLGSIADHIGISVENAYLLERSEEAAVIEERTRLARELHDSVTQSIYSVTLFAEAARQQMIEAENLDQVAFLIARTREVALQALREMRLLVYELRPPALEQDGLAGAIQQRLDAVEGRVGIHTQLICEEKPALPIEQEEALYRIVIEALNNILKHAGASQVIIRITHQDGQVTLEIEDNGRGFNVDEVRSSGGLGLIGMRERVEHMGGELNIDSEINKGSRIQVIAPVQTKAGRRLRRQKILI